MPKVIESFISLIEFVVIVVFSFHIVPYFVSAENYTNIDEVHSTFPIAIIENGIPKIVKWSDYIRSPKIFSAMLLTDPSKEMYTLGEYESFSIEKVSSNEYGINYNTDNYKFWSSYAIDNGVVTPNYFRVQGGFVSAFVGMPVFIFAIFLTSILNWIVKKNITRRSRKDAVSGAS